MLRLMKGRKNVRFYTDKLEFLTEEKQFSKEILEAVEREERLYIKGFNMELGNGYSLVAS